MLLPTKTMETAPSTMAAACSMARSLERPVMNLPPSARATASYHLVDNIDIRQHSKADETSELMVQVLSQPFTGFSFEFWINLTLFSATAHDRGVRLSNLDMDLTNLPTLSVTFPKAAIKPVNTTPAKIQPRIVLVLLALLVESVQHVEVQVGLHWHDLNLRGRDDFMKV